MGKYQVRAAAVFCAFLTACPVLATADVPVTDASDRSEVGANTPVYDMTVGGKQQDAPDESVPVAINAGHSDAWYDPQTAGQGFFITVLPELESIFLAWFTFDTERPSANVTAELGEPGHRWLTAFGDYSGASAVLEVELTSGGIFAAAQPAPVQTPAFGTITLEFPGCDRLELAYELPAVPRSGVIELQRISNDKVALCEELSSP